MSSIKDQLREKAKGKLAVNAESSAEVPVIVEKNVASELSGITREIRSDLDELREISEWWQSKKERVAEIQKNVVERLIYVRDHKKKLLGSRTFENYLTSEIGITKGYFYEQLQAYNVCVEYNKKDLFGAVDTKVLVNIAREENKSTQQKLINKAPSLTRDYFKKSDVSDSAKKYAGKAKVNKSKMIIKVTDPKVLRQIESLLRLNGIEIEYE